MRLKPVGADVVRHGRIQASRQQLRGAQEPGGGRREARLGATSFWGAGSAINDSENRPNM